MDMTEAKNSLQIVFGNAVEKDGEYLVVEGFLYFRAVEVKVKTIRGERRAPGWELTYSTDEDVIELAENQSFNKVVVEAAKFYGGWLASKKLEGIALDSYAKEFQTS